MTEAAIPHAAPIPATGVEAPAIAELEPPLCCADCGEALAGRFCHACGQDATMVVRPIQHLLRDVVDEFLKLDARIVQTLALLVLRPGQLTTDYLAGRRTQYVPPFKLYFFVAGLWFLLFTMLGHERNLLVELTAGPGPGTMTPAEDRAMIRALAWYLENDNLIWVLAVPVLAAALSLMQRGSGRLYIEHLVFMLHLGSFVFLISLVELIPMPEAVADLLSLAPALIYAYLAGRRFYALSGRKAAGLAGGLALACLIYFLLVMLVAWTWFMTQPAGSA